MNYIQIKSLKLQIEDTAIIHDITLSINQGEIIAILGPSGCGKTSFLNVLSGIIQPSGGKIFLEGHEVTNNTKALCSYMFQDDLLFPWRSIYKNVLLGIEVTNPKLIEEKKEEALRLLDFFGLKDFYNKYPHQLSGGMRRRAAFVRTLLNHQRDLFLFDEPTAGLDYLLRLQLEDQLFLFLMNNMKTSVIITHDIETAVALADRILIFAPRPTRIIREFEAGFARSLGTTTAVREHPDFGILFQEILNCYAKYGTQSENISVD